MSTAFLCVQFRNLLPSEQHVLLARALWSDMLQAGARVEAGDAILTITQNTGLGPHFEAELSLPRMPRRGPERDADPLIAIDKAFARWTEPAIADPLGSGSRSGQNATTALGG